MWSAEKCINTCPMDVDKIDISKKRINGTECILCINGCKKEALKI